MTRGSTYHDAGIVDACASGVSGLYAAMMSASARCMVVVLTFGFLLVRRDGNRAPRPPRQVSRIFDRRHRHAVILHRYRPIGVGLERLAACLLEVTTSRLVDREVQNVAGQDAEEHVARIETDPTEHRLRLKLANLRQLTEHELTESVAYPQRCKAARTCALRPQLLTF